MDKVKYTKDTDIKANLGKIIEVLELPQIFSVTVGIATGTAPGIYTVEVEGVTGKNIYISTETLNGAKYIGTFVACHFDTNCFNEWDDEPYKIAESVKKEVAKYKKGTSKLFTNSNPEN